MKLEAKSKNTHMYAAIASGLTGATLFIYGNFGTGFGLTPLEDNGQLVPTLASLFVLFFLIAVPAILKRKYLLLIGLAILLLVIIIAVATSWPI